MLERLSMKFWAPPWVRHEHLARYRWACRFVSGMRTIDAACGTGYGVAILASEGEAACVTGFDVAEEAIAEATRDYGASEGVEFQLGDVTNLPLSDREIDTFTCFETIEHVPDDHALLAEAARILKPGGKFICSTPNRSIVHPGASLQDPPRNRHHIREYTHSEFRSLLDSHFESIDWYGQTHFANRYIDLLQSVGRRCSGTACRLHQFRKLVSAVWRGYATHVPTELRADSQPEVLIAVCSNG